MIKAQGKRPRGALSKRHLVIFLCGRERTHALGLRRRMRASDGELSRSDILDPSQLIDNERRRLNVMKRSRFPAISKAPLAESDGINGTALEILYLKENVTERLVLVTASILSILSEIEFLARTRRQKDSHPSRFESVRSLSFQLIESPKAFRMLIPIILRSPLQ